LIFINSNLDLRSSRQSHLGWQRISKTLMIKTVNYSLTNSIYSICTGLCCRQCGTR